MGTLQAPYDRVGLSTQRLKRMKLVTVVMDGYGTLGFFNPSFINIFLEI